jgi:hypothetical protein
MHLELVLPDLRQQVLLSIQLLEMEWLRTLRKGKLLVFVRVKVFALELLGWMDAWF